MGVPFKNSLGGDCTDLLSVPSKTALLYNKKFVASAEQVGNSTGLPAEGREVFN